MLYDLDGAIAKLEVQRAELDSKIAKLSQARDVAKALGSQVDIPDTTDHVATNAEEDPAPKKKEVADSESAQGTSEEEGTWRIFINEVMPVGEWVSAKDLYASVIKKVNPPMKTPPYSTVYSFFNKQSQKPVSRFRYKQGLGFKRLAQKQPQDVSVLEPIEEAEAA